MRKLWLVIRQRFIWKLMISYLIVTAVGLITLVITIEFAIPTAFQRHLAFMEANLHNHSPDQDMGIMQDDLFNNFRSAMNEAILLSAIVAFICVILVSLIISHRVVTPIQKMMKASQWIAAGHYQERVIVLGEDEFGQLAHSFNQMATTLEQTETMRRQLIGDVSHELRTPLSSIKGYMEGLIDGVLPAEETVYQQVYREADRLQRLVNDLQALSQIEAQAYQLQLQSLAINPFIKQISHRLQPQFKDKGLTLSLNLASTLPAITADEDRLSQLFINLIGNALQYTPPGGQVTITTELRPQAIQITITDTGIGISADDLPHLFTRFYRVDKSRSRAGGGTGIGLTIAHHLVEAHQGQIWAESDGLGHGSRFIVQLPHQLP